MNKKIGSLLLIIAIFLIGTFLRFYNLGNVPNSLDWDEVSWGYNAYAILQTGKDEYGTTLPISFKAFVLISIQQPETNITRLLSLNLDDTRPDPRGYPVDPIFEILPPFDHTIFL